MFLHPHDSYLRQFRCNICIVDTNSNSVLTRDQSGRWAWQRCCASRCFSLKKTMHSGVQVYFYRALLSSAHVVPRANSILPCTECCLFRAYFVDTAAEVAVGNRTTQLKRPASGDASHHLLASLRASEYVPLSHTNSPPGPLCSASD